MWVPRMSSCRPASVPGAFNAVCEHHKKKRGYINVDLENTTFQKWVQNSVFHSRIVYVGAQNDVYVQKFEPGNEPQFRIVNKNSP